MTAMTSVTAEPNDIQIVSYLENSSNPENTEENVEPTKRKENYVPQKKDDDNQVTGDVGNNTSVHQ